MYVVMREVIVKRILEARSVCLSSAEQERKFEGGPWHTGEPRHQRVTFFWQ